MINRYKGSKSDYWNTPKELYNNIINKGYIDYNPENSYIDPFNKNVNLYFNKKIYINPPFSILNKPEWIKTVNGLLNNGNDILLLLPARTDTKQFHELLKLGLLVEFIKGRLKYNDSKSAPFPSLWVYSENYSNMDEIQLSQLQQIAELETIFLQRLIDSKYNK